ncbi:A disintegrin and metalloproteinase with thrombospondin motifs like [Tubulanus polymorphus]|uniref:A disintegrin and metalloproteinase with thrombospondin motifs like n=1 Tax=Tubulanus polymorphus TaxID=672921 RepID=UPI003DA2E1FF
MFAVRWITVQLTLLGFLTGISKQAPLSDDKDSKIIMVSRRAGDAGDHFNMEAFGDTLRVDTRSTARAAPSRNKSVDVIDPNDVQIYAAKNNKITPENLPKTRTRLHKRHDAVYALTTETTPSGEFHTVDGWFTSKRGDVYRVEPVVEMAPLSGPGEGIRHTIRRQTAADLRSRDYDTALAAGITEEIQRKKDDTNNKSKRTGHHGNQEAILELLLVIDNSIYRYYKEALAAGNEQRALMKVRLYYSLFITMMNQRYENLQKDGIFITIVPAGLIVSEDRESARWAEQHMFRMPEDGKLALDASVGLEGFKQWVKREIGQLPKFDHAMTVTRYALTRYGSVATSGMAFVRTVCMTKHGYATSIIEENGGFSGIGTATHELGHSLSAKHDGQKKNVRCPMTDNYVMSPSNSMDSAVLKNFFQFSECTKRAFKTFLESAQADCLYDTAPKTAHHNGGIPLPGQVITVEKQCKDVLGEKSGFCRLDERFMDEMCSRLWCKDPKNPSSCVVMGQMTAALGATCGDKKWCINGECVHDEKAPHMRRCHFGEADTAYCKALIETDIEACKSYDIRTKCCKSCPSKFGPSGRFG